MAVILVGMADLRACRSPDSLTTLGLGSCVGICLYDKTLSIIGMAHIMLPNSGAAAGQNRAKFADTGIDDLVELMVKMGASRPGLRAKLAGGAHMFSGSDSNILKVGERNVKACEEKLGLMRIPVQSSDTGGSHGRTIEFLSGSAQLRIRTVGCGEKII